MAPFLPRRVVVPAAISAGTARSPLLAEIGVIGIWQRQGSNRLAPPKGFDDPVVLVAQETAPWFGIPQPTAALFVQCDDASFRLTLSQPAFLTFAGAALEAVAEASAVRPLVFFDAG